MPNRSSSLDPWSTVNQSAPVDPASEIPTGGPYNEARDAGVTWNPGGPQAWARDNSIDPNTGQLVGPGGLVPHQYGLQYQALHEQAIWRRQQALLSQGMAYGRGALGLLQSYRPGGGAALESNIYGQLGQMSFQRAQLTQPMDLLADYRREQDFQARRKANRAAERNMAIQIAGMAAGAVTAGLGYAALGSAITGLSNGLGSQGGQQPAEPSSAYPMGQQTQQPAPIPAPQYGPTGPPSSIGPSSPMGAQSAGPGMALQSNLGQQQQGGAKQVTPGAIQQPGQPQGGQEPQQGHGGQPGQPQAAGAAPVVGANGDFSPQAYAVRGAASTMHPIQQMALARVAAFEMESDPVWQGFNDAIDQRLMSRYVGAA